MHVSHGETMSVERSSCLQLKIKIMVVVLVWLVQIIYVVHLTGHNIFKSCIRALCV